MESRTHRWAPETDLQWGPRHLDIHRGKTPGTSGPLTLWLCCSWNKLLIRLARGELAPRLSLVSPKVFSPFCHRWSFRSLPLSPLACLVGDTSFPAQSSTWLHRYYLNWTKLDNAITKFDWFVFIYLDDILIFSQNKRDHVQHVRRVLQRLLENCLFVKVEKCQFHAWSVPFLGFIFSPEGIRMDPAKVKAVADWPTPDNRRVVQRFLGFANFYRRFIRNFSQVALPLTYLTSTKKQLCWSSQA